MLLPGGQVGGVSGERIAGRVSLTGAAAAYCVDEIVFWLPKRVR